MGMGRMLGLGVAAITMVAVAMPAEAQRRGGRHHRHHDRVDGGDVLLGALLVGGIVAIASSSERRDRERRAREDDYDRDAPPVVDPQPPFQGGGNGYADITDADGAADACAAAAESTGMRFARIAHVGSIDAIDPSGPNWLVRGTIQLRNDYRSRGEERPFRCSIAGAEAPVVRIDGYSQ